MAVPAIVRALRPTTLQVLCAVGFFHGISMFVYTIRQRCRLVRTYTPVTQQSNQDRHLIAKQSARPRINSIQVIRLSPRTDALKFSNMTQQQKIAAALLKAGSSNSPSWYDIDRCDSESGSSMQVITAAPPTSTLDDGNDLTPPDRDTPALPVWKINVMFSVSVALTILSLCFFLRSLR